jgi:DNA-binding beta-propeller fold protein YncE
MKNTSATIRVINTDTRTVTATVPAGDWDVRYGRRAFRPKDCAV